MNKKKAILIGFILLIFLARTLISWYVKLPACVINTITGLYCPGCGGTRMAMSMISGRWHQAFRYNPFLFTTLPIFGVIVLLDVIWYIKGLNHASWFNKFLKVYGIALVMYGIMRNFIIELQPTVL